MKQAIIAFHQDKLEHWLADLACVHTPHVRHDPLWQERLWVIGEDGRSEKVGSELICMICDLG